MGLLHHPTLIDMPLPRLASVATYRQGERMNVHDLLAMPDGDARQFTYSYGATGHNVQLRFTKRLDLDAIVITAATGTYRAKLHISIETLTLSPHAQHMLDTAVDELFAQLTRDRNRDHRESHVDDLRIDPASVVDHRGDARALARTVQNRG